MLPVRAPQGALPIKVPLALLLQLLKVVKDALKHWRQRLRQS